MDLTHSFTLLKTLSIALLFHLFLKPKSLHTKVKNVSWSKKYIPLSSFRCFISKHKILERSETERPVNWSCKRKPLSNWELSLPKPVTSTSSSFEYTYAFLEINSNHFPANFFWSIFFSLIHDFYSDFSFTYLLV